VNPTGTGNTKYRVFGVGIRFLTLRARWVSLLIPHKPSTTYGFPLLQLTSLLSAQSVAIADDVRTRGIPRKVKSRDQCESLCGVATCTFVMRFVDLSPLRHQVPYLIQGRRQDRRFPARFASVCDGDCQACRHRRAERRRGGRSMS
jgi:hypothetical protein